MCILHDYLKVWITKYDGQGIFIGKCWEESHWEHENEAGIYTIVFHLREVTQWHCPD